jgi:hypothetical protein
MNWWSWSNSARACATDVHSQSHREVCLETRPAWLLWRSICRWWASLWPLLASPYLFLASLASVSAAIHKIDCACVSPISRPPWAWSAAHFDTQATGIPLRSRCRWILLGWHRVAHIWRRSDSWLKLEATLTDSWSYSALPWQLLSHSDSYFHRFKAKVSFRNTGWAENPQRHKGIYQVQNWKLQDCYF